MLEIEIVGARGQTKKFSCLIDTGFNGFLSVPLLDAFPVGLILDSFMKVTLANGVTETKLVCMGTARIDGADRDVPVLIEPGGSVPLFGTELLKEFGLKLLICPTTGDVEVVLYRSAFTVAAGQTRP